MRIWSVHPRYLDPRGLVALWREALLAQAVLQGNTKGYRSHPQLSRFRLVRAPVGAIADYLRAVRDEARTRGYRFRSRRISRSHAQAKMTVTRGQLEFEWQHLLSKLRTRDQEWYRRIGSIKRPRSHPLFRIVPGPVESWEKSITAAQPRGGD